MDFAGSATALCSMSSCSLTSLTSPTAIAFSLLVSALVGELGQRAGDSVLQLCCCVRVEVRDGFHLGLEVGAGEIKGLLRDGPRGPCRYECFIKDVRPRPHLFQIVLDFV